MRPPPVSPDEGRVISASVEFLIPSRTERPANDPIFALNAEAAARRASGETLINATVGALLDDDGRLAILPTVIDVLREVPPREGASYAPLAGSISFQQAVISELLGGTGLADHAIAVATPGGTGALRHTLANFLEPGHALLTSSLHWGPYRTLAEENSRRLDTFAMFDEAGDFAVDALETSLLHHLAVQGRALIFLNDPCQYPTGSSMREHEWRAVAAVLLMASATGPVTLLVDVAYYLYGSAHARAFLEHLKPLLGKVELAFAWTASKSYTQYGARIGALIVVDPNPDRRKRVQDSLSYSCRGTWSNCNHTGMIAITRVIQEPSLRTRADQEREVLRRLLDARVNAFNLAAKSTNLRYPRYDGGFFTTVLVPEARDAKAIAARLRERGVFVVPQTQGLRIALCSVAERDVPRLVDEVSAAMRIES
ncbi:MAG: aminotransferase class I/II-fold pyridoxal phosphate-dependent enzyme [Polyangiales bacterium]